MLRVQLNAESTADRRWHRGKAQIDRANSHFDKTGMTTLRLKSQVRPSEEFRIGCGIPKRPRDFSAAQSQRCHYIRLLHSRFRVAASTEVLGPVSRSILKQLDVYQSDITASTCLAVR